MKHFIFANDQRVFVIRIKMMHCKEPWGCYNVSYIIFESRSLRAMSEFDHDIWNVLRG